MLHSAAILWSALLYSLLAPLLSLPDHSWLTASVRILLRHMWFLPLSMIIAVKFWLFIVLFLNIHVGVIIIMMLVAITCHIHRFTISVMMFRIVGLVIIFVIPAVVSTIMRSQWIFVPMSDGLINMAVIVNSKFNKPTISVDQDIVVLMSISAVTLNMRNFITKIIII